MDSRKVFDSIPEQFDKWRPRYCDELFDDLTAYAARQPGWTLAPDNFEGVRVSLDKAHGNGWFLLRLSVHDPIMPLNVESDTPGGVKLILSELSPFLSPLSSTLDLRVAL